MQKEGFRGAGRGPLKDGRGWAQPVKRPNTFNFEENR